jgi:hypothetical protein
MLSYLARRALIGALVAAAGAVGSYAVKHYLDRARREKKREEKTDVSRWEGEGGSPPDVTAAVPHQPVTVR